nr:hypothetical protein [Tanacetum cinerariifolium]
MDSLNHSRLQTLSYNLSYYSATEPTVFDDEEVTMTMAQILIKMKAEKARLLDEQMAKRLHDEEVKQAVAREKQEKMILKELKCYNSISIAQARKNMIVYLKNIVGYKMEHFRGMTYDKLLELMLSKRSRKNTKYVNAANEELAAAKHKLMLLVYCC